MRIKQNITLFFLIILLLSAILSIDRFNLVSIPLAKNKFKEGGEIKVNSRQLTTNSKINIIILWDAFEKNKFTQEIDSKRIVNKIVKELPTEIKLGLRVLGIKNNQSVIPLAENNNQNLIDTIKKIKSDANSEASIGANLKAAAADLTRVAGIKHIILITDGYDDGKVMPDRAIKDIEDKGIKTHIVHVGELTKINQLKLKNLAELGSGKYFSYLEEDEIVPTINLK